MITKKRYTFITIEGGEGSGKTTQSRLLRGYLEERGFEVLLTREPGGSVLADNIRNIILNPNSDIAPLSELFLFEAARAQHIEKLIYPALKIGKVVVCDRFTDATVAYQGYGKGLDLKLINKLNLIASVGLEPTLTLYLDIMPFNGLSRAKKLNIEGYGNNGDRIERESIRFHENVRKGYIEQARKYPKRIRVIEVQETTEKTHMLIKDVVNKVL